MAHYRDAGLSRSPIKEPDMGRSYKSINVETTVSSVADAFASLQSLGEECREIVDNANENLQQTSRIQTFDETASTLENISEPTIPECVADLPITVYTQQSARKGRSESRSVRRDNEVSVLRSAQEAVSTWLEDDENEKHEEREDVEQFANDLEEVASEAEGCEFPGMFG
jgi:hypothetical protein